MGWWVGGWVVGGVARVGAEWVAAMRCWRLLAAWGGAVERWESLSAPQCRGGGWGTGHCIASQSLLVPPLPPQLMPAVPQTQADTASLPRPAPRRMRPQAIPQLATAPVLVLVGAMMMGECVHIDWSNMLTAVPAFLTIVIQPFTFSIANGIYAGLTMALLLYFLTGQFLQFWPFGGGLAKGSAAPGGGSDLGTPLLSSGAASPHARGGADTPTLPPGQQVVTIPITSGGHTIPVTLHIPRPGTPTGDSSAVSTSLPYERGSFTMYINTSGSLPHYSLPIRRGSAGGSSAGRGGGSSAAHSVDGNEH